MTTIFPYVMGCSDVVNHLSNSIQFEVYWNIPSCVPVISFANGGYSRFLYYSWIERKKKKKKRNQRKHVFLARNQIPPGKETVLLRCSIETPAEFSYFFLISVLRVDLWLCQEAFPDNRVSCIFRRKIIFWLRPSPPLGQKSRFLPCLLIPSLSFVFRNEFP